MEERFYYVSEDGLTVYILKGRDDLLLLEGFKQITEKEYLSKFKLDEKLNNE